MLVLLSSACLSLVVLVTTRVNAAPMRKEISIFFPNAESDIEPLRQLEQELGIRFTSIKFYRDWSDSFNPEQAKRITDHGAIPELTWQPQQEGEGIVYQSVLQGHHDAYLKTFAHSVRESGVPIRISLAPEMNSDWVSWGIGKANPSPESHQQFWQYVVTLFRQEGVTNVSWIWSPNILTDNPKSQFNTFYPGDSYVDFLGLDGYNWGTTQSWSRWQSFEDVFSTSYEALRKISSKPCLIMETGSAETGGNKAAWIDAMFTTLSGRFPQIQGLTWFHINKETDWRIDSSPAAKQAFANSAKRFLQEKEQRAPTIRPTWKLPPTKPSSTLQPTISPIPETTPIPLAPKSEFTITLSPTPFIRITAPPQRGKWRRFFGRRFINPFLISSPLPRWRMLHRF